MSDNEDDVTEASALLRQQHPTNPRHGGSDENATGPASGARWNTVQQSAYETQTGTSIFPTDTRVDLTALVEDDNLLDLSPHELPRAHSDVNTQGSFVTVLSLWTTMMGSSLLVMPWAIQEAGLVLGLFLIFLMACLTCFPTTLIYKAADYLELTLKVPVVEFQDICSRLLGPRIAWISLAVSLLNLIGAMVVYWILMSTMLYQIGCFFYEVSYPGPANITDGPFNLPTTGYFYQYWNDRLTVPFYLVFLLLPVICLQRPTFFTKLSSFGIVAVIFMITFVTTKIWTWGFHATSATPNFTLARGHFPALTGTLSMGFFIHNCILSMTAHHQQPQKKTRDTAIAFLMVAVSYMIVGGGFYAAFPDDKKTIADNFLKNFSNKEVLALAARALLFFQMFTVFPLLAYLFRVQLFYAAFGRLDLSYHFIIILNAVLVGVCLLFASLYPRIGDILRVLGSICGLVYVFTLPLLLDLAVRSRAGEKSLLRTIIYVFLIGLGLANFIAQFVIPTH
ncbi:hypothetical protein RvY_10974 [Ramazzottius varieornatus]|uniref:Amino acid transporter transmembrane domain-containing protein n=1 Tax=Ramazzottius varieornatus TaxID=947166 RepID=A0A1D1VIZ9_RAMVA|nr:hypothetical protein RvY_10974 [Ramazzottius varieornatus]